MSNSVKVVLIGYEGEESFNEFKFNSLGELEAFILGMEAVAGWNRALLISSDSKIFYNSSELGCVSLDKLPFRYATEPVQPECLNNMYGKPSL